MKILFFIESLRYGGKERRIIELLKNLCNYPNIHIELVLSRNEIHYKEVFEFNIPIHIMNRQIAKKDFKPFYEFFKISRTFRPDIIHSWGNLVSIYAIPTKLLLKIPMINSQIVDAPNKLPRRILSQKLTFPFSNILISNSNAGLTAYNAPIYKSTVIYNGFNFDRLNHIKNSEEIRKQFKINTKFVIAMVASFNDLKDYTTYISAAKLILKDYIDITFLCVGEGDDSKYYEMVPLFLKDRIKFLGVQKDILSIMNICDFGVLSTFTEGISNAVMEFMALGKPVIATDGGGTNELIIDKVTGYLVKPMSPVDLAEKINSLLFDGPLKSSMGVKGKERILEKFNINNMTKSFINEYNKFIAK